MCQKLKISLFFVFMVSMLIACNKDSFKPINKIIPEKILDEIAKQIPLYEGNTPPTLEGDYVISPCYLLYSSFSTESMDSLPDYSFTLSLQKKKDSTNFIKFVGDNKLLRIDSCENACLVGSGSNFTAYYSIKGQHYSGITYKAALILSGTKSSEGLKNCYLVLVLLNKSVGTSDTLLMPEGSFRIINDGDNVVKYKDTSTTKSCRVLQKSFLQR